MQLFTAKQYLKIDIANNFGLDKLSWDDRLRWFDESEPQLLNLLPKAENPALYYAGIKAWEKTQKGEPTGYPISLDATSSGIQILSVLTGDRSAARLSNVIDTGVRNDAYTEVYREMQATVGDTTELERDPVKKAVMTAFYGSEAVPKQVFGEGPLLGVFFSTLEKLCPAVWELNKALLAMWNPEALKYSWVLPDNFHVHVKVTDQVEEEVQFLGESYAVFRTENRAVEKGRSLGANVTHSIDGMVVRELVRRCDYNPEMIAELHRLLQGGTKKLTEVDPEKMEMVQTLWDHYQNTGFLSARILQYLDATNLHLVDRQKILELLTSLPKKPFNIIPVHDCFRVHANYGNDLRQQYNLQLSLIARSNLLQSVISQLLGQDITVTKIEDFAAEILDANYALS